MKRLLILGLILSSSVATAECYTRSEIRLTRQNVNAGPTDLQKLIVPDANGNKCTVRYRIHVGDDWYTAEGSATAQTESEACARAVDIGRGTVLAEIEPSGVSSDTQMVCSDITDIRVRKVHAGETIWESETDMHVIPAERTYFSYKGTQCRMFVERNAKERNMYLYQGIMCRADSRSDSKWLVVDKY